VDWNWAVGYLLRRLERYSFLGDSGSAYAILSLTNGNAATLAAIRKALEKAGCNSLTNGLE
jgi:transcriptional/translational regulatory protein YebC/TACO1